MKVRASPWARTEFYTILNMEHPARDTETGRLDSWRVLVLFLQEDLVKPEPPTTQAGKRAEDRSVTGEELAGMVARAEILLLESPIKGDPACHCKGAAWREATGGEWAGPSSSFPRAI